MCQADAVVCVCDTLKHEVISRGVPEYKTIVVPNAVGQEFVEATSTDRDRLSNGGADLEEIRQRLRPSVVGYVGSVRRMEGIEELVRAGAEMVRRGRDVSVLVVGDGDTAPLKKLAADLGIEDRAVFTGKVPHTEIARWYSLIDIFVVSRPDEPVTRTVTPIKPLEAMALGRPLVVSDLPALREIITDGETGVLYPAGDPLALADACERLLSDPSARLRLGEQGRDWVTRNRTWSSVVHGYDLVYAAAGCE